MPAKVTYASCCDSSGNALDDFYMPLIKKIHNNIIKTRKRYVQTKPVTLLAGWTKLRPVIRPGLALRHRRAYRPSALVRRKSLLVRD